jgi:molybdopterin synthase catalytic subunit
MPSMVDLTNDPIDVAEILRAVQSPAAGALDVFLGTTRNTSGGKQVVALEYQAYRPMAVELMEEIARSVKGSWGVLGIAILHRLGRVEVGEISVAIAVSSAHRAEAFGACREIIDRLKSEIPIWKKEFTTDGSVWVGGPT